MLYVIIADGAFDQVCEAEASAKREKRDLERMGFEVRVRKVADWAAADALEEKLK